MQKPLKTHLSIDDQISKLESRGLIIEDVNEAKIFFSNVNYYRFSGYLHDFKISTDDKYIDGLTFSKIRSIYDFDAKFSRILMFALESVEESLKTKFSYTLSSDNPSDPLIYLDKNIYRDSKQFLTFTSKFNALKTNNSGLPFIKHHDICYCGELPIWVAVEILTMGNIDSLYSNLIGKYQKKLACQYNTGPDQLSSWIKNARFTRNHLAHYMRVYNYKFGRSPKSCSNHKSFTPTGRIFDQVVIMGYLFPDKSVWNNYVLTEISRVFEEYSDVINLSDIGFPSDWLSQLSE